MMEDNDHFLRLGNPILWGIILTGCVVSTYYFLAVQSSCQKGVCQTNWEHFWVSSPNEIGDTLAGIAGILAFLWIIVTVFLQSQELREQRKEFKKMAKAQEAQVKALQAQAAIFEDEKKQRSELKYERVLDQTLEGLVDRMTSFPLSEISWVNDGTRYEDVSDYDEVEDYLFVKDDKFYLENQRIISEMSERESFLKKQADHLQLSYNDTTTGFGSNKVEGLPELPTELLDLVAEFDQTLKLTPFLAKAQRKRLENLKIEKSRTVLAKIASEAGMWANSDKRLTI